jgi:hypothetical protein
MSGDQTSEDAQLRRLADLIVCDSIVQPNSRLPRSHASFTVAISTLHSPSMSCSS